MLPDCAQYTVHTRPAQPASWPATQPTSVQTHPLPAIPLLLTSLLSRRPPMSGTRIFMAHRGDLNVGPTVEWPVRSKFRSLPGVHNRRTGRKVVPDQRYAVVSTALWAHVTTHHAPAIPLVPPPMHSHFTSSLTLHRHHYLICSQTG